MHHAYIAYKTIDSILPESYLVTSIIAKFSKEEEDQRLSVGKAIDLPMYGYDLSLEGFNLPSMTLQMGIPENGDPGTGAVERAMELIQMSLQRTLLR